MVTKTSRLLPAGRQRGTSMIEVLVAMVVIAVGLLGLAGLQVRLQSSEMESYQRTQALLLVHDMASRIAVNRNHAASYPFAATAALGAGVACPTASASIADRDLAEWCGALQGAAETSGGSKVGAMIGGRGCVESVDGDYLVTVAWQGLTPIAAPPASVRCGAGSYDTNATACTGDLCRRVVTTLVRVADL
jgi:type IV pilus assembly protein PilV